MSLLHFRFAFSFSFLFLFFFSVSLFLLVCQRPSAKAIRVNIAVSGVRITTTPHWPGVALLMPTSKDWSSRLNELWLVHVQKQETNDRWSNSYDMFFPLERKRGDIKGTEGKKKTQE